MPNISVMLADDHTLVRTGLRSFLEQEEDIVVIGEAHNGKALVGEIQEGLPPNIVLMDLQMPVMCGIETTRYIRKTWPETQVIGLTAIEEQREVTEMINAGASHCLSKASAPRELLNVIRTVYSENLDDHYHIRPSKSQSLTQREQQVVSLVMQGHNNKEIARRLIISERTVHTHLRNIYEKLDVNNRTEAAHVAKRDGWIADV